MQYKVFIIDDEPLARKSMKTVIEWEKYNCTICGDAESAEEAFSDIRRLRPDIIFTDIRLHEKTGLEMIKELGNEVRGTKIIVMTCYREFDYVAEAMRLGVFAFLLKPLGIDDITENLKKAIAEINRERNENYQKKLLSEIFYKEKGIFETLSLIGRKLNALAPGSGKDELDEIKNDITGLLCGLSENENLHKVVYRYLQYALIETYVKLEGPNRNSQEFVTSNIDYLSDGKMNADDMNDWLVMQMDNIFERCLRNEKKDARVAEMQKFAKENYKKNITLEDAAKHVLMSYHYASKLFKKETGRSFVDYVNYIRIEKAKELCRDIRYRDYEIAFMVGIENIYYFSRLFKKYTGMSVREYRENLN